MFEVGKNVPEWIDGNVVITHRIPWRGKLISRTVCIYEYTMMRNVQAHRTGAQAICVPDKGDAVVLK